MIERNPWRLLPLKETFLMTLDLNHLYERRHSGSRKWDFYPHDVLPLWVADMDFPVAEPILLAMRQRLEHPFLGYSLAQPALLDTLVHHLQRSYDWGIDAEQLLLLPGVEPGISMALKGLLPPGSPVVIQTPNHSPLRAAAGYWQHQSIEQPLIVDASGHFHTDFAALDQALAHGGALLLSNPHNPVGKVFEREELQRIADLCVARDALIISDEIHADILFDERRHIPIASLGTEVAARTVTLMSASKAYNIAGTKTAFAVIGNPELRKRFNASRLGMVDSVNALGLEATRAAYAEGGPWLAQVLTYLQANRDWLTAELPRRLPGIKLSPVQGTYLAWLDCSALNLQHPQRFFLEQARVAFSAGEDFGAAWQHCLRLNFGCPRALLEEALTRMQRSLEQR